MNIRKGEFNNHIIWAIPILFLSLTGFSQEYPHETDQYPFVRYDLNKLLFPGDSSSFEELYEKFDEIIFGGAGQVDIMHMGGSHVQAGVFSSQVRKHFQSIQPGLNSYRGFLFPFKIAGTNNPVNYRVGYTGSWEGCRNVERRKACLLGLSGMSATTYQPGATIRISFNEDYIRQPFTRVKVYHLQDSSQYAIEAMDTTYTIQSYPDLGYTELSFLNEKDTVELKFVKTTEKQTSFTLFGLKFENDDPGFAYHAIGVNGADVPAYLRCDLLELHTQSVDPDLVLFAIGINDANTSRFNKKFFKDNYDKLIVKLKAANPELNIVFITNNDSYYRRRYPNENGKEVREAMMELAEKHNAAVWDLFSIMGGLDSISQWDQFGLAQRDKIHFTRAGYQLVGDLLFSALVRSYEYHIKSSNTN